GTIESIKSAMEELNKEWSDIASHLYQSQSPESGHPEAEAQSDSAGKSKKTGEDGNVENAEYEVINEK
ncbi:MAG: molecular chaperone DnaK, partial [Chlorobium sp.]